MSETKRATRKIVQIDEDKCDGCGLCVPDCAEGAIQVIDGKARLLADNLCDGLGNCLGACPRGAITIIERDADKFDEVAVKVALKPPGAPSGCPGSMARSLSPAVTACPSQAARPGAQLSSWPVQLSLVPTGGRMWDDKDVLIAADCVGYAMGDFHTRLLAGGEKTLVIACPKLDDVQSYVTKLTEIFANNNIRSLTVAHMEVPCCTGMVMAVKRAIEASGRADLQIHDVTVGIDGSILSEG